MGKKELTAIIMSALFYLVLSLFSIRKFLFVKGTIGHNWDWPFPALPYFFKHTLSRIPYVWADKSVGYSIVNGLSTNIWWAYSGITGLIMGGFHTKFVILSTTMVAGVSMFLLVNDILKSLNKKNTLFPSFIAGLFFAFSPFLFSEIVGGAVSQFQTWIVIPLAILFFRKYISSRKFFFLFLTSIIITYIITSSQNFIFIEGILFTYIFIQKNKKRIFFDFMRMNGILLLLNIYWVVPFIYNLFTFSFGGYVEKALNLADVINNVPQITEILVGHGYVRPFYDIILKTGKIYWLWFVVIFALVMFMFYLLFFQKKEEKYISKETLFWSFLFFASIIFATGAKVPLGGIVLFLYKYIPFFPIFRSPQHFLVLPTISLGVLIGLSSSIFLEKNKNKIWNILMIILIMFWIYPSYITGDIGKDIHYNAKIEINKQTNNWYVGDHIDYYSTPLGYQKIYSFLEDEKGDFKVLFLPMYASPYYHKTRYQLPGGGIDPLVFYSKHPAIFDDLEITFNPITSYIEYDIYNNYNLDRFNKLSELLNIQYIILRKDVSPIIPSDRDVWDWRKIKENIEFSKEYEKIHEDDYVAFYKKNKFLKHIYSANNFKIVKNTSIFLDHLKEDPLNAIFITEDIDNSSLSDFFEIIKSAEDKIEIKEEKITYIKKKVSEFEKEYEWQGSINLIKNNQGKSALSLFSVNKSMGRAIKDFHVDLSYFDGDDTMNLWVYVKDTDNMLSEGMNIFIDSFNANMSNFFLFNYENDSFSNGWNRISIKKPDFRTGGGKPDWSHITRIGLDIYSRDNSTLNITISDWYFERNSTYDFEKFIRKNKLIFDNLTGIVFSEFNKESEWIGGLKGDRGIIAKSVNSEMARITKETDYDLSRFEDDAIFKLRFKINDLNDMHPNGIFIFFDSKTKSGNNIFLIDPRRGNFSSGINEFIFTKKELKIGGDPDWKDITRIGLDVYSEKNKELEVEFLGFDAHRNIPAGADMYATQGGVGSERNIIIKNYNKTVKRKNFIVGDEIPKIKHIKKNPIKYKIDVIAENPYFIIFSEAYHPDWRLYKGDVNWFSVFFKKPIKNHFVVNGYANAWYIEDFEEKEYTIYYFTQSIFMVSSIISVLALLFFLLFSFFYRDA